MNRLIKVIRPKGILSYKTGLCIQQTLAKQPAQLPECFTNYILILEHNPVYTIGIRTKDYTEEDEKFLKGKGAEFYRTNRGGLITFHGPGQLVAYPILHLKQFTPSMRWYVATLENTVIELCKRMGVTNAKTTENTGIWVDDNKICAIGIHGSQFITTHGIGLNCNTVLSWFDYIVPCGIENKGVTSLSKELGRNVSVDDVIPQFLETFEENFQCKIEWCEADSIK